MAEEQSDARHTSSLQSQHQARVPMDARYIMEEGNGRDRKGTNGVIPEL